LFEFKFILEIKVVLRLGIFLGRKRARMCNL